MRAALLAFVSLALLVIPVPPPNPTIIETERIVPVPIVAWVVEHGLASWYAEPFHGRIAANGERYDKNSWTMATRHLPLGTFAKVRYDGRECIVRVVDRGPYIPGRRYDVSEAVAQYLGFHRRGLAEVEVAVLREDLSR